MHLAKLTFQEGRTLTPWLALRHEALMNEIRLYAESNGGGSAVYLAPTK